MSFITFRIVPPSRLVQKRFERLRRKVPLISRDRMYKTAVKIRHAMKEKGKRPTYPIHWDSARQRRAFFATDGFGRGIPTKRTDEYVRAWRVIKAADNEYDVGNPLAHAKYIGGTARSVRRQSRIHRGRWPLFKVAIENATRRMPKAVKKALQIIARQEGFRSD